MGLKAADLGQYRVGLYAEALSRGVSYRDATHRAADALMRIPVPMYARCNMPEPLESSTGDSSMRADVAVEIGSAGANGYVILVPASRLRQLEDAERMLEKIREKDPSMPAAVKSYSSFPFPFPG